VQEPPISGVERAARHKKSSGPGFHSGEIYFILNVAMKKRKRAEFSATKAVKANARERVGQPKPVRVLETEPREGRRAKYKPQLDELVKQED